MSDYAQLGNMLIDINTLEQVSNHWGNRPLVPVKNLPGRFWAIDSNYELGVSPFGAYLARDVHTNDPKRTSLTPLAATAAKTWVAADLARYVSLKDGDLWGGSIDWSGNTVTPAKNLTQIGLLNNLEPITWCDQHFYFFRPQATDKPYLRINTENGNLLEMAGNKVLSRGVQGSPDGCFLFKDDNGRMIYSAKGGVSQLHVMDLRRGDTFDMDATFDIRNYTGKLKSDPLPDHIRVRFWIDRNLFWTPIGWYDLGQRNRITPTDFPEVVSDLPYFIRIHNKGFRDIPGGRYLDIVYQGYPSQDAVMNKRPLIKRYRIDRLQGTATALPIEPVTQPGHGHITWVDENRYVYARWKGGLNDIGTWLYDVTTGQSKKLSRFFADERQIRAENRNFGNEEQAAWSTRPYASGLYLALADKNRIIFSSTRGKIQELVSVSLDGKELARKAVPDGSRTQNAQFRLRRLPSHNINLPFKQRTKLYKKSLNRRIQNSTEQHTNINQ